MLWLREVRVQSPMRNSFPAEVDRRQANWESQSGSSAFRRSTASQAEEPGVPRQRKCWRTNNSEVSRAQTSQPLSRVQPRSLPHRLSEGKLVRKSWSCSRRRFQGRAESFLLPGLMTNAPLQPQKQPHGVFQEENRKYARSDTNYGTGGYKKRQRREKQKDGEEKRPGR